MKTKSITLNDMDMQQLVSASTYQFQNSAINSIAELHARERQLFAQSKKLIDANNKIPITLYVHTSGGDAVRVTPQFPKELIAPVMLQFIKQAPNATALFSVTEAWGLNDENGNPEIATPEMKEWIALGNSPEDHTEAISVLVVSSLCCISGHGVYASAGFAPINEQSSRTCGEPRWMTGEEITGTLLSPFQDELSVIEDAEFLRSKQSQPRPGGFDNAAKGW